MIPLSWTLYAVAAVGIAGYVKGCSDESARGQEFKEAVAAEQRASEKRAEERAAIFRTIRRFHDQDNTANRARIAKLEQRLRNDAGGIQLPSPTPGSRNPENITFNREQLTGTLRRLVEGVLGLLVEGDQARVDLDTAKRWVQDLEKIEVPRPASG